MPIGQRVVLIGGGPNAVVTAFYLAKGGFKPLVLERREFVGDGAITEEFAPGFRASTLAHTVGPLRSDIAADMQLERFQCHMGGTSPRLFPPTPADRGVPTSPRICSSNDSSATWCIPIPASSPPRPMAKLSSSTTITPK